MLKYILVVLVVLLGILVILPFVLNIVGIQIFQFGSIGGGRSTLGDVGMLRSEDGGENWEAVSFSEDRRIPFPREIFDLTFHPSEQDTIFIGTKSSGIWKSETRGVSWKKIIDSAARLDAGADVYKIVVARNKPEVIYTAVFQRNKGWILKSKDGGRSFSEVYFETEDRIGVFDIYVNPVDENHVIIATGKGGILESRDGGKTWHVKKWFTDAVVKLVVNPRNILEMYALLSGSSIFKSLDGGINWLEVKENIGTGEGNAPLVYPPPQVFNPFSSFSRSHSRIFTMDPQDPSVLYMTSSGGGLLRSRNGGISWEQLDLLLPPDTGSFSAVAIHPRGNSRIFVASGAYLHLSKDGGSNWDVNVLPTKSNIKVVYIHPLRPDTIFVVLGR